MVIYISILNLQSHYIFHSDYGFAKDELLLANIHEIYDKRDALRSELMQTSGVKDASLSLFPIASQDQYMGWGRSDDNHHVNFTALPVDWHYLQAMGIEIVEGRDFNEHDSDCYIINEAARSQWSWVEMDKPLLDNDLTVVGVCRNVRFASTRMDNNSPMAFVLMGEKFKDWGGRLHWMNVRVAEGVDKKEMCQKIKDLCMKFGAKHEPTVIRLDQKLEDTYKEEFRFIRQVLVFSVICMIITLIGVFCMTMFETEYRRKEIGIRKVMGSTAGEILSMLCRRYVWLLIGSFVVAAPLAWYIGNQWLQSFAERTPIYWWLFPVALLAVATVTLVTIIIQSWRAATENPVNSIKNE
jgi:putative ABC transport system permease protein